MIIIGPNISPLPFYDDISMQNHRKEYSFGQIYPLIVHSGNILPFQFLLQVSSDIEEVQLHPLGRALNAGEYIDITASMKQAGLSVKNVSGYSVVKYPATGSIPEIKSEGFYYIAMRLSGLGWLYSEVFNVRNDISSCLFLEYRNSHSFEIKNGIIDFSEDFKFKCYIDTLIGKPEYTFEEEATERMGRTFIETQVSKKVFKFSFVAPEYLCDALRLVRLCDSRYIYSKGQSYDATLFSIEPQWLDQGDLASVNAEFETDDVIAGIGGYSIDAGDFNNDFNNDYLIKKP